jgi:phage-related protein
MEGVTYKDWAKYHGLKKQFEEWRSEVRDVALKHEILDEAKKAAENVVEDSMELAAGMAKELARLKDVGKWKVAARDTSDNFDTRAMPAAVVSAASEVAENVQAASQKIVGTSQGNVESIASQVTDAAANAASIAESILSKATDAEKEASSTILGDTSKGPVEIASSSVNSAASVVSESASSAANALGESAASVRDSLTSAISDASSIHPSFTPGTAESSSLPAGSVADAASSSVSSMASAASKNIFAGAMAEKASSTGPILDNIIDDSEGSTYSEKMQNVINEAGDRYADVTKAVSEALFGTSQGTLESATSLASEQYSSALAAASSVLYGSAPGTGESIASMASAKYSDAVAA